MHMATLEKYLTANRVAAISMWLAGLAAFICGVAHTLPGAWPNYALAAAGLLTKLVTVIKFLDGAQKWDALAGGSAALPAQTASGGAPPKSVPLPTDAEEMADQPTIAMESARKPDFPYVGE
jgi:hypothetical protein